MGTRIFADVYETAEAQNQSMHQPYIPDENYIVKAFRTWFVFYNNPTFTNIYLEVWSDDNSEPGKLLHTSTNVQLKADLFTLDNAYIETWFEFDNINLKGGVTYHLIPQITGYTYSASSLVGWIRAIPEPVYTTNLPTTLESFGEYPYLIYQIGAKL